MITMSYGGIDLASLFGEDNFLINDIKGRGPVQRSLSLLEVPGRDGAYLRRASTPPRELEITFTLKASTLEELRERVDRFNEVLGRDEIYEIRFSDEDLSYYGIMSDVSEWQETRTFAQGTIIITCVDPHKYGALMATTIDSTNNYVTVSVQGNEDTPPTFEATVLQATPHVDIALHTGEYIRVGQTASAGQAVYNERVLVLDDQMNSMAGWSPSTDLDFGYVSGQVSTQNGYMYPSLYGAQIQPLDWQGPGVKKSTGQALDEFEIEAMIENLNVGPNNQTGVVELYALDGNNNVIAKVSMGDTSRTVEEMVAGFAVGNHGASRHAETYKAMNPAAWNDYRGVIRITRRKNRSGHYVFSPYFALVDKKTGKHTWVSSSHSYTDFKNFQTVAVTQVQVAFRTYPSNNQGADMRVEYVKVYKLNEYNGYAIPAYFMPGDLIEIDHSTEDIRVNGESRKDLKDFGGNFFRLRPGMNTLMHYPKGAVTTRMTWRSKHR